MVKVYWTGWAHYCEFVCPDVSWLKASMSECIREAIIFRVLRKGRLSDWRSAMVEVTIWSPIWNAMAFDCFNRIGKSVWCKKVYWESIGLCGLSVCQWCIWKRRQCNKGYRVPVDLTICNQVCVCDEWFCSLNGRHVISLWRCVRSEGFRKWEQAENHEVLFLGLGWCEGAGGNAFCICFVLMRKSVWRKCGQVSTHMSNYIISSFECLRTHARRKGWAWRWTKMNKNWCMKKGIWNCCHYAGHGGRRNRKNPAAVVVWIEDRKKHSLAGEGGGK